MWPACWPRKGSSQATVASYTSFSYQSPNPRREDIVSNATVIEVKFTPVEPDDQHGGVPHEDHQVHDHDDRGGHDNSTNTHSVLIPVTADHGVLVENMATEENGGNGAAPVAMGCLVLAEVGNLRDRELAGLAAEINWYHDAYDSGIRTSFQHALAAGEGLLRAKDLVGHGRWIDWVEENCKFALRTGQKYMRLAQRCRESKGNAPLPAHLTIEAVLEVFALPHSALANGSGASAVADYLDAGGDSEQLRPNAHDESRVDAKKAAESVERARTPTASRQKAQAVRTKDHEDRCRRLRKLSAAGTTLESQIVTDRVNAGMGAVLKEVRRVLLDYGKRKCSLAARNQGIDPTLMAMAMAKELKNRLDPCELFKPK